MEEQVYRIWTVLSAFEESSAACISEMLRHVSSGHYIEGVRMAEKFVLHVETLFSALDDLSVQFKRAGTKGEIPGGLFVRGDRPFTILIGFCRNFARARSSNAVQESRQLLLTALAHA